MLDVAYGAELDIENAVYHEDNCNYAVPHNFEKISVLQKVHSFHYLVVEYKESYLCIDTLQWTIYATKMKCCHQVHSFMGGLV